MSGSRSPSAEEDRREGTPRHLILFGKVPEAGATKTRLAPALGASGAARLYRAFLDDTVRRTEAVEVERRGLWLAGDDRGRGRVRERHPGLEVRAQRGDDLGERMARALEEAFSRGAGRALVVGTDHPTLPVERLERAFRLLASVDLVLGPSDDGGYYAVGVRREAWPGAAGIFRDVPWSTDRVLEVTRARARELGLSRRELPEWYDVDRPPELERLRGDAEPDSRSLRVLRALESET